jgi:DNA-binding NarL/FixJ family response regulator
MIRILVADDHPVVRQGLKQILEMTGEMEVVDEVDNTNSAIELATSRDYDAVILDISMPGRGGLDALVEIRRSKPDMPILMLSMHSEDQYAIRAMRSGARGYVTKDTAATELVAAVQRIVSGRTYVSSDLADKLVFYVSNGSGSKPHEALSDREHQVMLMIAGGMKTVEIAEALCLSPKTISTYRTRMFAKLHVRNEAELTAYVFREGLGV